MTSHVVDASVAIKWYVPEAQVGLGVTAGLSGRASVNSPNLVKQIPTNIGEHYAVLHSS